MRGPIARRLVAIATPILLLSALSGLACGDCQSCECTAAAAQCHQSGSQLTVADCCSPVAEGLAPQAAFGISAKLPLAVAAAPGHSLASAPAPETRGFPAGSGAAASRTIDRCTLFASLLI